MRLLTAAFVWLFQAAYVTSPDAAALLKDVALRYENATDYFVALRTTTKTPGEDTADFDVTLAASRPSRWMVRQRSRSADRFDLLIVADGSSGTAWSRVHNRHTIFDPAKSSERSELDRLHWAFFRRFTLIDRIGAEIRNLGKARVSSENGDVACIHLRLISGAQGWEEDLWIDPERATVRKSVMRRRRSVPETGYVTTTTTWMEIRIGPEPDAKWFRFTPPADSRLTNTLEYR